MEYSIYFYLGMGILLNIIFFIVELFIDLTFLVILPILTTEMFSSKDYSAAFDEFEKSSKKYLLIKNKNLLNLLPYVMAFNKFSRFLIHLEELMRYYNGSKSISVNYICALTSSIDILILKYKSK